jgi:hypothetical protein
VATSDPLEREALAFAIFACLLEMSLELDRTAVSVAVPLICLVGFRGNNRIIHSRHLALVILVLQHSVENNADEFQQLEGLITLLLAEDKSISSS